MFKNYEILKNAKGVTDYAVAKACGLGKSTFSDWKSGRATPGIKKLQKIADYFGVSIEFLLTGQDSEKQAGSLLDLTDEEQLLLAAFRQLNGAGQAKALDLVKLLLMDPQNKPQKDITPAALAEAAEEPA